MNKDNEHDNDFLDKELEDLNKVILSANQLVQQMGGANPMALLQQQYAEMAKHQVPIPVPVQPSPETVILHCVNKSNNPSPRFENLGDSGFDLRANLDQPVILKPMTFVLVPTGLKFTIQEGYDLLIKSIDKLISDKHILVIGSIDINDELNLIIFNLGQNDIQIKHGNIIAKGVVYPVIGSGKLTILCN